MSEAQQGKKGINWLSIFGVIAAIMVVKGVRTAMDGGFSGGGGDSGVVSAEELGITGIIEQTKVDVLNNGTIIVDGARRTLSEFAAMIPEWKNGNAFISFYQESRSATADSVGEAITKARLTLTPRSIPQ